MVDYDPIRLYDDICWDLTSEACHMLLLAPTGSGKSFLLAYLLGMVLKKGHHVFFVDAKNSDFGAVLKSQGVEVATSIEEIIAMLTMLVEKMEQVYADEYANGSVDFGSNFSELGFPANILVFDEVLAGINAGDRKQKQCVEHLLQQLALKGRMAGFVICLTSQYLLSSDLSQSINSQCQTRIILGSEVSEELFHIATRRYKKDLGSIYRGDVGKGYIVTPKQGLTYFESPFIDFSCVSFKTMIQQCIEIGKDEWQIK